MTEQTADIFVPTKAGEITSVQLYQALSRPIPKSLVKTKTVKGSRIDFIEWHTASKIMMKYAPGHSWKFDYKVHDFNWEKQDYKTKEVKTGISGELFVIGTLTVPCSDCTLTVQSSGIEDTDNPSIYGSAIQNAEANAFKRCCAKLGLGLYLYNKDK